MKHSLGPIRSHIMKMELKKYNLEAAIRYWLSAELDVPKYPFKKSSRAVRLNVSNNIISVTIEI